MAVVIITRFTEHLDWIRYLNKDKVSEIVIYNKGTDDNIFRNYVPEENNNITIVHTENVGKHNHTIAKYIYDNYNDLPETLIFLPGTIMMGPKKGLFFSRVNFNFPNIEKYSGFYSPMFKKVGKKFNYTNELVPGSKYTDFVSWKENEVLDRDSLFYTSLRGVFVVSKKNVLHNTRDVFEKILNSTAEDKNTVNSYYAERIWAHLFKKYSHHKNHTLLLN